MLKLLFQKLQIRPVLAPGKTADLLGHCYRQPGDNWRHPGHCVPGKDPPLGTANCPGLECGSFSHLILPESQSPHRTLFIPCYKTLGLERKDKMVC